MDKPPNGEKCLSLTGVFHPPRKISRPERYEVDDTPLSPPGSSSYLLFDSSTVFNTHPHKYRVLIGNNISSSKDESKDNLSAKHKPLGYRKSKSAVSLPSLDKESEATSREENHAPLSARAEQSSELFLKPKNLPNRKVSDTVVPGGTGLWSHFSSSTQYDHRRHSLATPGTGEDQLLENFKDAVTLNEEKPVSFQLEPFDEQKESMSASSGRGQETAGSLSTNEGAVAQQKYVVREIQPEPRRLFGFGPLYRPLPETVIEKQQPLTEMIQKEGLTAVGVDSTDSAAAASAATSQHKISEDGSKLTEVTPKTTKLETSMWMPFSF